MSASRSRVAEWAATAFFCVCVLAPLAPALPPPSPSPPVFQDRPFGPKPPATPPRPSIVRTQVPTPFPREWVIGGAAVGVVGGAALLFFAIREWRMSRLFGREYRFPVRNNVSLRLGGERSGGLMATARFGESSPSARDRSEAKQT